MTWRRNKTALELAKRRKVQPAARMAFSIERRQATRLRNSSVFRVLKVLTKHRICRRNEGATVRVYAGLRLIPSGITDTGWYVPKRSKIVPGKPSGIRGKRSARQREEILKAGLTVFARKGFQGASMDDIALELEATKGLLYYHFKTKEEILNSILADNPLVSGISAGLVAPEGISLTDAVRLGVERALTFMEANRELMRFIHVQALLSSKEAETVLTKVLNRLYEAAARWLESLKQRGQIRTDVETRQLGRFIVDAVINHFLQRLIFGSQAEAGYLDGILGVLREGVAPRVERGTHGQS